MRLSSWIVFGTSLGLYWSFPSTMWNFDGVACAAAIEYGDPTYFFHSQHLLYGFLGWLFWKPLNGIMPDFRALSALQILTPVFSAAGLVAVWQTLLFLAKDWRLAALLTVLAGTTAVFWVWTVEPQVYPLGFMGLAWATHALVVQPVKGHEGRVSFWQAVAIMGHLMHVIWLIPAAYVLWRKNASFKRYFLLLGAFVLLPYIGVLAGVLAPSGKGWEWIQIWIKGSAGLTADRGFGWHWGGWMGPLLWLKGIPQIFWGTFWPYAVRPQAFLWIVTAAASLLAVWGFILSWKKRDSLEWRFSLLWIGVYGLLLSTWEPTTLCYRLPDIFPLTLLLALGWSESSRLEWTRRGAAGLAALTAFITLQTRIRPMTDALNNRTYQEALRANKETPADTALVTSSSQLRMYLLYFTGRAAYYQP